MHSSARKAALKLISTAPRSPISTVCASSVAPPPNPPTNAFLTFRPPPRTPMVTFGGKRAASSRKTPAAGETIPKPRVQIPQSAKELDPKYKEAEKKVRNVIVALPIAIVTSIMLYQRLVLGEEQKHIVPPEATATEVAAVQEKP